jgi:cysteine dioxygenase
MAIDIIQSSLLGSKIAARVDFNKFEELVIALKEALGPSSGLTSDDVDVQYLTTLMAEYCSSESEWARYSFGDATRGYTRNLVDEGNGKSNLVSLFGIITPSPGDREAINCVTACTRLVPRQGQPDP